LKYEGARDQFLFFSVLIVIGLVQFFLVLAWHVRGDRIDRLEAVLKEVSGRGGVWEDRSEKEAAEKEESENEGVGQEKFVKV